MSDKEKYHATAWGVIDDGLMDIKLPSGQLCQAKKLEMEDVIRLNIVNELDTFTSLFGDEDDAKQGDQDNLEAIKRMSDSGNMDRLMETLNTVTVDRVVQPPVLPIPLGENGRPVPFEDRAPGVYVDNIKFLDKMAIFGEIFEGLSDMADFREEPEPGVGAVETQPKPVSDAVPISGVV